MNPSLKSAHLKLNHVYLKNKIEIPHSLVLNKRYWVYHFESNIFLLLISKMQNIIFFLFRIVSYLQSLHHLSKFKLHQSLILVLPFEIFSSSIVALISLKHILEISFSDKSIRVRLICIILPLLKFSLKFLMCICSSLISNTKHIKSN